MRKLIPETNYNRQMHTPLTASVSGKSFIEEVETSQTSRQRGSQVGTSLYDQIETTSQGGSSSGGTRNQGTSVPANPNVQVSPAPVTGVTLRSATQSQMVSTAGGPPTGDGLQSSNPVTNDGASTSQIPNPLRNMNTNNYVVTLGVLKPSELTNPLSYRSTGNFDQVIAKTSGGSLGNRWKTASELEAGGHAEYYIEDLEIDGVLAPNPNTGVSIGTSLSFTVIEPYSMGNFTQAVIGAARSQGFQSFNNSPFCIKIDFVGWDEYGQNSVSGVSEPIYIPILIVNMDINVSGQGAQYAVTAVPYSEIALSDHVNKAQTTVNASGGKVHEVLTTGERSVTSTMNSRITEFEDLEVIEPGDRFLICFPNDVEDVTEAIQSEEDATVSPTVGQGSSTYQKLLDFASDESQMNLIGQSELVKDNNHSADHEFNMSPGYYDVNSDSFFRNTPGTQPGALRRNYEFHQSEKLTHIIESIINESEYALERATTRGEDGLSEWYRISVNTFIERNPGTESQRGRPPMIYVFSVIPYYADEAKNLSVSEYPKNTEGLKQLALKSYNYIYTGKNEDVLDFDINFRYAFLQTAVSNFGQNTGQVAGGLNNQATANDVNESGSQLSQNSANGDNEQKGTLEEDPEYTGTAQANTKNSGIQYSIAAMFHNNIMNRVVDMVNAEMTIWGDPFFIPQQTGNWSGTKNSQTPGMNESGTVDYLRGDVFVTVDFRTPMDYSNTTGMMEYVKSVPQFSGLFSVWGVTSTFSGGEFKQVLKMIRRTGQTGPETGGGPTPYIESLKNTADIKRLQQAISGLDFNNLTGGVTNLNSLLDLFPPPEFDGNLQIDNAVESPPVVEVDGVLFATSTDIFNNSSGSA